MKTTASLSIKKKSLTDILFNSKWSLAWLLLAAALILTVMLGAKDLWTQEWRWAEISQQMLTRHDFFHPYLVNDNYYDKPLLSYWFIIGLSFLIGKLNLWAIRLPSAIAGIISVFCTYYLGKKLSSRQTGLLAAWMLMTSYFFIFWSRVGNADMLNLAGILLAVSWYFKHSSKKSFLNYSVFFLILAITSLFKGLIAPAITFIVLLPDLLYKSQWKTHLNFKLILAALFPVLVYLSPFIASTYLNNPHYTQNGLYLVFKENVLRYFRPFDHQEPFYVYLLYLPAYTFPWICFFIPAFFTFPTRWRTLFPGQRWFFWSTMFIFIFLTLSGSRRDYYILPNVPFLLLFTADWIFFRSLQKDFLYRLAGKLALVLYLLLLLFFAAIIPYIYSDGGPVPFAALIQSKAASLQPWETWHIDMIGTHSNLTYYLQSPNPVSVEKANQETKANLTSDAILKNFPQLTQYKPDTIIIIGNNLFEKIKPTVANRYFILNMPLNIQYRMLRHHPKDIPVALIPLPPPSLKGGR